MDETSVRLVIRITARISLLLFLGAFAGPALALLRPAGRTRWLERQRGRLLVGLAASHTAHLGAIAALATVTHGGSLRQPGMAVTILGGGVAYLFIYAMAATARTWSSHGRLHTIGMYYVWLIFFLSYGLGTFQSLFYLLFALLLLAALIVRLCAKPARI